MRWAFEATHIWAYGLDRGEFVNQKQTPPSQWWKESDTPSAGHARFRVTVWPLVIPIIRDPGESVSFHISPNPTTEEVERAKKLLDEPLIDFPFAESADKAHAIALGLLPYVREMIPGPTPNHLIEAPEPGTGKGLLVDAVIQPSLGHSISIVAQARGEEEWRKRLTACLIEGRPVILLDNIRGGLYSGVLAAALTALTWSDRNAAQANGAKWPLRVPLASSQSIPKA